jgi:hypothetical protein
MSSDDFATALLVASRCDEATYIGVARKFAESSFYNGSPMYTAALLFSGALHADCACGNWGVDSVELKQTWKSHLAAMISNRTPGWERIVLSLGDRLREIRAVKEAHFCYLVCGCALEDPTDRTARMSLLGCDHVEPSNILLSTQESLESFELTEALEWAKRQGNKNASLVSFQPFKLIYAMRLMDCGMFDVANLFLESIRLPSSSASSLKSMADSSIELHQIFRDKKAFLMVFFELNSQRQSKTGRLHQYIEKFLGGGTLKIPGDALKGQSQHLTEPGIGVNAVPEEIGETSYLSAKSNLMDVTGYSLDSPEFQNKFPRKRNEMKSMPPLQESNVDIHSGQRSASSHSQKEETGQPLVALKQESLATGISIEAPGVCMSAKTNDKRNTEKRPSLIAISTPQGQRRTESPPATAPPRIGGIGRIEKPKTTPAPSSGSSFGSLRSWIIKKFNPDATECHLPESEEQPYYDKERKRESGYPLANEMIMRILTLSLHRRLDFPRSGS